MTDQPVQPVRETAPVPEDLQARYEDLDCWLHSRDNEPPVRLGSKAEMKLIERIAAAEKRAADAEAQVMQWQTWGIVEIAVRNRSVADYMEHWEARALKAKAEAQVKALSRPLQELARASAKEICECFDIKVPRGVSYFNGILGTMAIIIETHLRGQSRDALIAARLSSAKEKP